MKIRELLTTWAFDADTKEDTKFEAAIGGVKRIVGMATLAVGGAAAAIFGLAHSAAETADETNRMADSLGLNVQWFQELQAAARRSDVDMGTLSAGMLRFQRASS